MTPPSSLRKNLFDAHHAAIRHQPGVGLFNRDQAVRMANSIPVEIAATSVTAIITSISVNAALLRFTGPPAAAIRGGNLRA